ncbi:uncharacterized protein LOC100706823 isoform X1 [Oreochromis niloticus]|uniref:uncharacterized protein LOC100706823 isoform X1 n=2 Tax=Oreochromis niloticus TaxID=8128 RepID=UPI0009052510|nr:uncharacterized protein LOC100706823 isoform X1 [Oreochromis niloticus]
MFFRCLRGRFGRIFALVFFVLAVLEATEFEGRPQKMREIRATLVDLAWKGRTYLGRLVGEQTYLSVEKDFSQVIGVVAESVANHLNAVLQYSSQFLQANEIQVDLPISKVTPEGLIFIAQWLLKVLLWYCLISHAFQLIGWLLVRLLRVMLKLLRVMVACLLPGWSGKLLAWRSKLKSWPNLKGGIKLKRKEEQPKKLIERLKSPSLSLPKS